MAEEHPTIRLLDYADPGAGKSTFAATFPKPMCVMFLDTAGKEQPYFDRGLDYGGDVSEILDLSEVTGIKGLTGQQVFNKQGQLIIQIEHYLDEDPERPIGSARFKTRLAGLHHHYNQWRTFVIDHISGLTRTFTYYEQFLRNPGAKDPRQWIGETTSMIERYIATRMANLRSHNVVVLAHIDEQKDEFSGSMVRTIKAPGRMRKGLADAYSEIYHGYVSRDSHGNREYWLQTQGDAMWMAASRLRPIPPDPCPAYYQALWSKNGNGK